MERFSHDFVILHISIEDCAVTREAVQAGNLLDIHIIDHIIVGRDGWISLRQRAGTIWRCCRVQRNSETESNPA